MASPIAVAHTRAAGDIVVFTGFVRDLALTYPGRYEIHVVSTCSPIWDNNPYIAKLWQPKSVPPGMPYYALSYGDYIRKTSADRMHFLTAFHRDFEAKAGVHVPVRFPKGDVHLTDWQKANRPVKERYWYLVAGGKHDFTTKIWSAARHQQVVNVLRQFGLRFVQDGAAYKDHWHPSLEGVLNLVNQNTGLQDMLWLIHHAEGVICTITCAMHMAAAMDKPCIVTAGGREHWWWEAYVNSSYPSFGPSCAPVAVPHRYLHTQDRLDCCMSRGCWRSKVTKKEPDKHQSYCKHPSDDGYGQMIPECLRMLTPDMVVHAVLSYYENGTLRPEPDTPLEEHVREFRQARGWPPLPEESANV